MSFQILVWFLLLPVPVHQLSPLRVYSRTTINKTLHGCRACAGNKGSHFVYAQTDFILTSGKLSVEQMSENSINIFQVERNYKMIVCFYIGCSRLYLLHCVKQKKFNMSCITSSYVSMLVCLDLHTIRGFYLYRFTSLLMEKVSLVVC